MITFDRFCKQICKCKYYRKNPVYSDDNKFDMACLFEKPIAETHEPASYRSENEIRLDNCNSETCYHHKDAQTLLDLENL